MPRRMRSRSKAKGKITLAAQPLGSLGAGSGGGVETTLLNLARSLYRRDYEITVVAPQGSKIYESTGIPEQNCLQVQGQYPANLLNVKDSDKIAIGADDVLPLMWKEIAKLQNNQDLVINFAYDWLSFYLSNFLNIPCLHLLSLPSCLKIIDRELAMTLKNSPGSIGVHSYSQASSYLFGDKLKVIGNGVDIEQFPYNPSGSERFVYVGRISPEKQIEHALEASESLGVNLTIYGKIQNADYFQSLKNRWPDLDHAGFLPTEDLIRELGQAKALLVTSKAEETFCLAAAEAQCLGVPVIAYKRGSLPEVVDDESSGILVTPDSVEELKTAMARVGEIKRHRCREFASQKLSLGSFTDSIESWISSFLP